MYSNFKEQAIEYAKQAVQEDHACNYARAFSLYMNALEYFKTHLKYEKDPKIREEISQNFTYYLRRAEEIRSVLDGGEIRALSNNGDSSVAARPKSNPKHAQENPNNFPPNPIKQAIEYVKQAVQEDNAGNYSKALYLYMNALEDIITHLKYEKNPKIREAITTKFTDYLRRVEEIRVFLGGRVELIRAVLEEGGDPSNGGDCTVAAKLKMLPKIEELNSAIVRDKSNVKQPSQEAVIVTGRAEEHKALLEEDVASASLLGAKLKSKPNDGEGSVGGGGDDGPEEKSNLKAWLNAGIVITR